jgi:MFS family permease
MFTMYGNYLALLLALFAGVLVKKFMGQSSAADAGATPAFKDFQRKFLIVYLLMMAADWMQGPYVYRLYSFYGFSRQDNGILFIAGFGSSLVFGTWAGPIADTYGRKFACMLYGVTYILSCATKHFPVFWILMVGRLLGGIATSILWSSFEAWMVSEHNARGFAPELVNSTASLMFTCNGILAILSGFVAQWSVDAFEHPVAPFDVSAIVLIIGTVVVHFTWTENYGDASRGMVEQMQDAVKDIKADKRIAYVGLQQALFEGAMYTFVFMWTPALEDGTAGGGIPHGLIFACFMIACSLGGTLFGVFADVPTTQLMRYVFVGASASMAVPMMTSSHTVIMGAFIGFEVLVGLFWPGIMTLRSTYVPEHCRATVINLFRMPLNAIVCLVLYMQGSMSVSHVFTFCMAFHAMAAVAAVMLSGSVGEADKASGSDDGNEDAVAVK